MSTLAIIIPTWCERSRIAESVRCARDVADEVVVSDASSPDGTAAAAKGAGALVVSAPKGRGPQLDAGARAARSDVLLFLHADARLGAGARRAVLDALEDARVLGGNFYLRFEGTSRASRIFTWANDARRRWLRIYYGDSALFVRRATYEALGGFPSLPIFEDYALVRRLERAGRTAYIRDVCVTASARRFERAPLRTLLLWTWLQTLYSAGVPASRLARFYADAGSGRGD